MRVSSRSKTDFAPVHPPVRPPIATGPQQWEYFESSGIDLPTRNGLGLLGWELVSVTQNDYGVRTYHFKRPIS